jgi:hypothetical protein
VRLLDFMIMPALQLDNGGCDYHPSLADHRRIAQWMIDYIDARPQLWTAR